MEALVHAVAVLEAVLALVGLATIWAKSKAALSAMRQVAQLAQQAQQAKQAQQALFAEHDKAWDAEFFSPNATAPKPCATHRSTEKTIQSGKYRGLPYQALEGLTKYEAQLTKFNTKDQARPGNKAMQAYYTFARLHKEAVDAGSKA